MKKVTSGLHAQEILRENYMLGAKCIYQDQATGLFYVGNCANAGHDGWDIEFAVYGRDNNIYVKWADIKRFKAGNAVRVYHSRLDYIMVRVVLNERKAAKKHPTEWEQFQKEIKSYEEN